MSTCPDCGLPEGPGCPVCDALSHAEVRQWPDGTATIEAWREDDPGMPVVAADCPTVSSAVTLALHHEAPRVFLTLRDPRGVAA